MSKHSKIHNYIDYDKMNQYPYSCEYEYETYIDTLNFDEECENDIRSGNGFIIESSPKIKKDVKNINGIFSSRFGQTLSDTNPYIDRYKCQCGNLKGRINHKLLCPQCGNRCEFVDDNFSFFGWFEISKDYKVIHPAYYKKIDKFLGGGEALNGVKRTKLENIIDTEDKNDINGKRMVISPENTPKDEPFYGLGMIDFVNEFDNIMNYYYSKNKNKKDQYDDIMENRAKVFCNHLPVFTTLLRPMDIHGMTMTYEPTNGAYRMMAVLVGHINRKASVVIDRNKKLKNKNLYGLQSKFMELYAELEQILATKKGDIRSLIGGRYNFSSRNVIVQNPDLRIDQVTLPYIALCILLEQRIKNVLHKLYNLSFSDAHDIWYKALIDPDPRVEKIIISIINHYKDREGFSGLPIIINRNPTIKYGGVLQMFCVGFTHTYTMAVPVQPLPLLNADFDGDVLNIFVPLNNEFVERAFMIFNPRNAMYISTNDGYFNTQVSMQRDTLINANTLAYLGEHHKSKKDIEKFLEIANRNKTLILE